MRGQTTRRKENWNKQGCNKREEVARQPQIMPCDFVVACFVVLRCVHVCVKARGNVTAAILLFCFSFVVFHFSWSLHPFSLYVVFRVFFFSSPFGVVVIPSCFLLLLLLLRFTTSLLIDLSSFSYLISVSSLSPSPIFEPSFSSDFLQTPAQPSLHFLRKQSKGREKRGKGGREGEKEA